MLRKYLCEKDENAYVDLDFNILRDSDSDNMLLSNLNYSSHKNISPLSNSKSSAVKSKKAKKRKVRVGTFDIVKHQGHKIKIKHRCSS